MQCPISMTFPALTLDTSFNALYIALRGSYVQLFNIIKDSSMHRKKIPDQTLGYIGAINTAFKEATDEDLLETMLKGSRGNTYFFYGGGGRYVNVIMELKRGNENAPAVLERITKLFEANYQKHLVRWDSAIDQFSDFGKVAAKKMQEEKNKKVGLDLILKYKEYKGGYGKVQDDVRTILADHGIPPWITILDELVRAVPPSMVEEVRKQQSRVLTTPY